jgi:hypothetical protein
MVQQDAPSRDRSGRHERSPRYPGVDLAGALELLRQWFEREKRTAVTAEEAVRAWGHQGLSGPARVRLAALRQYGLIEPVQGGKLRVSDDGLTFCIESPGSPEYIQTLRRAALTPPLFRHLWDSMRDASDSTIRSALMRERGFALDGADRVIKAYRATIALAKLLDRGYDDEAQQDNNEDIDMPLLDSPTDTRGAGTPPPPPPPPVRDPNVKSFLYGLSPGVDAEVTLRGPFTIEDLELLRDYIELQERGLRRSLEKNRAQAIDSIAGRYHYQDAPQESGLVPFDRHEDAPSE